MLRFAAMVAYGCRFSEVYSLVPTGDGGTASVLTLKRKGFDPKPRTAIALSFDLVERNFNFLLTGSNESLRFDLHGGSLNELEHRRTFVKNC